MRVCALIPDIFPPKLDALRTRRQTNMVFLESWIVPVSLAPFIGSFLGVVVARAGTPERILIGRSVCMLCGTTLAVRDLIPLGSWIVLQGRCRNCGQAIGHFPLVMELAALLVALWSASLLSGGLLWASCILGWLLLTLAATDLKYFLLPDFLTFPAIAAGLLATWTFTPAALLSNTLAAAGGYFSVVAMRYLYGVLRGREGIGLGDAKLLAAAGAWVSWYGLPSVILLGALTALAFALWNKRSGAVSLADRIPLGAFLAFGTWIVWLYGPLTFD